MAENDIQNSKPEELDTIDTQISLLMSKNRSADTPRQQIPGHSKIARHYSGCGKGVSSAFESATTAVAGFQATKEVPSCQRGQTPQARKQADAKNTFSSRTARQTQGYVQARLIK